MEEALAFEHRIRHCHTDTVKLVQEDTVIKALSMSLECLQSSSSCQTACIQPPVIRKVAFSIMLSYSSRSGPVQLAQLWDLERRAAAQQQGRRQRGQVEAVV